MNRAGVLMALALVLCGCTELPASNTPAPSGAGGVGGVGGVAGMISGGAGGMLIPDAATNDAASDAALPDAAVDSGEPFELPLPRPDLYDGPALLSETGLYADLPTGMLAAGAREYRPLAELWSDGAEKKRWLELPPGGVIDTQDMDDWIFPVDTRVFKEFSRDGKRIETRMVWKRGPGDWPMVAFLWNPEQTEAYAAPDGRMNARFTEHDVPDAAQCPRCHDGLSDRLLGSTALQLSHSGPGLTIDTLIAEGLLTNPPAAPLALPGDDVEQRALGYLHANCGHCHNPNSLNADRLISVYFWQSASALTQLEDTVTYRSLVTDKGSPLWIDAVLERMGDRDSKQQMPPLATEQVDADGMAAVGALMDRLRADVPQLPPRASGGECANTEHVFEVFKAAGCAGSFCHGSPGAGLYWSTAQELHDLSVGVAGSGDGCGESGLSLVEPGDPQRSLLYLKLLPGPPCGIIMPPQKSLSEAEIADVAAWIFGCTAAP